VAVAAAVKIARAKAVVAPAPQNVKPIPAELSEEDREIGDDPRTKTRIPHDQSHNVVAEGGWWGC
jgi:hypothetical protein